MTVHEVCGTFREPAGTCSVLITYSAHIEMPWERICEAHPTEPERCNDCAIPSRWCVILRIRVQYWRAIQPE